VERGRATRLRLVGDGYIPAIAGAIGFQLNKLQAQ
jgi:hypothetical protein